MGNSVESPRASEIAYVRFRVPDLSQMESFLTDFGLATRVEHSSNSRVLFANGVGSRPYIYVAEAGAPEFLGFGFEMASPADFESLCHMDGASAVETIGYPGGGRRIRFVDPDGFQVDAVIDQATISRKRPPRRPPFNFGREFRRQGKSVRLQAGPSCVHRIGHCVLSIRDFAISEAWYKARFGLLTSDEIYKDDDQIDRHDGKPMGAFLRCNLGVTPADHHTLFLLQGARPGLNHVAFEVDDWDSVMTGHDHLAGSGYQAHWGVGKHVLGSQVIDYWRDPFGNVFEHYADGDVFDSEFPAQRQTAETLRAVQWGQPMPVRRDANS